MAMTDEQMARLAAAAVAAGVPDMADDEDRHGRTPGDYFRMGYNAARADRDAVLEECGKRLDSMAELYKAYSERDFKDDPEKSRRMWDHYVTIWDAAKQVRALKEKPE